MSNKKIFLAKSMETAMEGAGAKKQEKKTQKTPKASKPMGVKKDRRVRASRMQKNVDDLVDLFSGVSMQSAVRGKDPATKLLWSRIHHEYGVFLKETGNNAEGHKFLKTEKHENTIKSRVAQRTSDPEMVHDVIRSVMEEYMQEFHDALVQKLEKKHNKEKEAAAKKQQRDLYIQEAKKRKEEKLKNAMETDDVLLVPDNFRADTGIPAMAMSGHTRNINSMKRAQDTDDLAHIMKKWNIA